MHVNGTREGEVMSADLSFFIDLPFLFLFGVIFSLLASVIIHTYIWVLKLLFLFRDRRIFMGLFGIYCFPCTLLYGTCVSRRPRQSFLAGWISSAEYGGTEQISDRFLI